MMRMDVLGLGLWGRKFGGWEDFRRGLETGAWPAEVPLRPPGIPPREQRRAPVSVKMAVEVMHQACQMAGLGAQDLPSVFTSAVGDMAITDYMCRTLAAQPGLLSPTQFHNSVHNAAAGYWSISTGSHAPADAVCAFEYSAAMALFQGALKSTLEKRPVIVVMQDVSAPQLLMDVCPALEPVAVAVVVGSAGGAAALARLELSLRDGVALPVEFPRELEKQFSSNPSAALLPLLSAIARGEEAVLAFAISPHQHLEVRLSCT